MLWKFYVKKKNTQVPVEGSTTVNECVMGRWKRWRTQWRDGRESKAKRFIRCGERRKWRLIIRKEQSDMKRAW